MSMRFHFYFGEIFSSPLDHAKIAPSLRDF